MNHCHTPKSTLLTSFFERLAAFGGVLRAALPEARLSAEMVFRGRPEKRVLLDLTRDPVEVVVDDSTRPGQIHMAVDAEIMHEILLGQIDPGVVLARRQLLLRGSAIDLARFVPLFGLAPALYREHLADMGWDGFARPSGWAPLKEVVVKGREFKGDPIPIRTRTRLEEVMFRRVNRAAWVLGYGLGTVRHRLLKNLSIFEILAAMSRGMEAATPLATRDGAEQG